MWKRHLAIDVTDNESPTFVDLVGDSKPELVCSSKGCYGWAAPDPADPTRPWGWHNLSPNKNYHKFTHGLGVGDANGDGRQDLLEKDGWWEQPASSPTTRSGRITRSSSGPGCADVCVRRRRRRPQ
jgi:hypothetical protein